MVAEQKSLMWIFGLMTVCMLPVLAFNVAGQRLPKDSMDMLGIARTTLGNIGGCPSIDGTGVRSCA